MPLGPYICVFPNEIIMKSLSTELKWAFIFTGVALLWMVFEKILGWHDRYIDKHAMYTLFFMIPAFIIYFLAIREKRETLYDGNMTWAEGFKSGLILSVFVAILALPSQWITNNIISPEYFANAISHAVESGKMGQEQARNQFNPETYMIMAPIFSFFAGLLTSAVVCIFVKRT